jgi:hypothetical protein
VEADGEGSRWWAMYGVDEEYSEEAGCSSFSDVEKA